MALSIDRLFFVVYVTTIIMSVLIISLNCVLFSDTKYQEFLDELNAKQYESTTEAPPTGFY